VLCMGTYAPVGLKTGRMCGSVLVPHPGQSKLDPTARQFPREIHWKLVTS
jgi:hypothetical protein